MSALVKRETGVNPVRSRRCNDGVFFLFLQRKRKPLNRKLFGKDEEYVDV